MDGWMEQENGRMGGWYRENSMALAWLVAFRMQLGVDS